MKTRNWGTNSSSRPNNKKHKAVFHVIGSVGRQQNRIHGSLFPCPSPQPAKPPLRRSAPHPHWIPGLHHHRHTDNRAAPARARKSPLISPLFSSAAIRTPWACPRPFVTLHNHVSGSLLLRRTRPRYRVVLVQYILPTTVTRRL